jgi:hypothetical protein
MAIENKTAGADRNKFAWFHARETTQRHKAEAHTAGRFIEYEKKDVNPKISTAEPHRLAQDNSAEAYVARWGAEIEQLASAS